jgi:pyridoxamine 5'-phosphate oxidase
LLKNYGGRFIFYTNYNSDKGKAIANNLKYVFLFLAFYGTTGYNKVLPKTTEISSDNYFDLKTRGK